MEVLIDKRSFNRILISLATPIALQSLLLASVAAADALMLGKLSQNEMTAVSLATQIQFIQNVLFFAVTGAGSILGAQYWGKQDIRTMEDIFNMVLRYAGFVSLLFFALCTGVPHLAMRFFTSDPDLIRIGSSYLRIAGWSYLITGISQSYLMIMKVSDHVRPGTVISMVAVVMNILLNAVLIFGMFSLPKMGARGAALATTISRIIELALCLVISAGPSYIRPVFKRLFRQHRLLRKDFLKQCFPLLGGSLCWGVGFTTYTAIMGHMGTDAAAANSVAAVIRDLICCLNNGIGSAAAIMVGNVLGTGDLELGKAYGTRLKNMSYIVGIISTAIALALIPASVRMVVLTDRARGYLTWMMVIMAFYMIGRSVNTITINGVLDGGGDTIFDLYSLVVSMWMIAIPLAFAGAFYFHWSPLAVYACTCLDELGKIPWVMIRFRKYKWVQDLTRNI